MSEGNGGTVFKNEPVMVLVLGLLTCGLYLIYWNMKTAEVINEVAGEEKISNIIAILGGCCLPIGIYFWYLVGQELPGLAEKTGNSECADKGTILLVLGILFPPVSAMLMQGYMNGLWGDAE